MEKFNIWKHTVKALSDKENDKVFVCVQVSSIDGSDKAGIDGSIKYWGNKRFHDDTFQRFWNNGVEHKLLDEDIEDIDVALELRDKYVKEFKSDSKKYGYNSKRSVYRKKCYQYDLDSNFIREWDNINDAAICYGVSTGSIYNSIIGKTDTSGGFIWRKKRRNENVCKVDQLDKRGNLIKVWNSVYEASRGTGVNKGNISACLHGNVNQAGGYLWKYHNDKED